MDIQGLESISKMRRKGEGREILRSDFKHPPADLAVLGHDSFSVIPSLLIFCLLEFGWEEKVTTLKCHIIHNKIICYSMKVLFTCESISGSIFLVASNLPMAAQVCSKLEPGEKEL